MHPLVRHHPLIRLHAEIQDTAVIAHFRQAAIRAASGLYQFRDCLQKLVLVQNILGLQVVPLRPAQGILRTALQQCRTRGGNDLSQSIHLLRRAGTLIPEHQEGAALRLAGLLQDQLVQLGGQLPMDLTDVVPGAVLPELVRGYRQRPQ